MPFGFYNADAMKLLPSERHINAGTLDIYAHHLNHQALRGQLSSGQDDHPTPRASYPAPSYRQPQPLKPDATFSPSIRQSRVQPQREPPEHLPLDQVRVDARHNPVLDGAVPSTTVGFANEDDCLWLDGAARRHWRFSEPEPAVEIPQSCYTAPGLDEYEGDVVEPSPHNASIGADVPNEPYDPFTYIQFDDEPVSPSVPTQVSFTGNSLAQAPPTLVARDLNTQPLVPEGVQLEPASGPIRRQRIKRRDENYFSAGTENRPDPMDVRRQGPVTSLYHLAYGQNHSILPVLPASVATTAFAFDQQSAPIPAGPLSVPPDLAWGPMPTFPRDEPIVAPISAGLSVIDRPSRTQPRLAASSLNTREPFAPQPNAGPSRFDGSDNSARTLYQANVPASAFGFNRQSAPIPTPLCLPPAWTYGPMPTPQIRKPVVRPVPKVSSTSGRPLQAGLSLDASVFPQQNAPSGPSRGNGSDIPVGTSESTIAPVSLDYSGSHPQQHDEHTNPQGDSTLLPAQAQAPANTPTPPSVPHQQSAHIPEPPKVKRKTAIDEDFLPVIVGGIIKHECLGCHHVYAKSSISKHRERCAATREVCYCKVCGEQFKGGRKDSVQRHRRKYQNKCESQQNANLDAHRERWVSEPLQKALAKDEHIIYH
ncbi:hypothetical protein ONZ45_g9444 [Pleurotus djamor]|nr:hypothetical protein ONZ45_g9444 [Pleurotus djamor]